MLHNEATLWTCNAVVRAGLVERINPRAASTITTTMKTQSCGNLTSNPTPVNTESCHGLRRAVNMSTHLPNMGSMDLEAGRDAASAVRHRCRILRPKSSSLETWAKKPSFRHTESASTQRINRVPVHHDDAQPLANAQDPTSDATNIGSAEIERLWTFLWRGVD